MNTRERLSYDVITALKAEIRANNGNELFAVGKIDAQGVVFDAFVAARGTSDAVPLLRPHVERGDVVMHNHPSGDLTPSGADLGAAASLGQNGIGFYILNNEVTEVNVVAEPVHEEEALPLDEDALAAVLEPGGALSKAYPDYEERPTQVEMLRAVCRAFNESMVLVAEAGTGVGKSLAYLLPALAWVGQNHERVLVSTATINLQQQILEKDIPLVRRLLGKDIKAVLVKGRGNYVCLNRLNEALEEYTAFDELIGEFTSIKEWTLTTRTGSRDDLSFYPSNQTWSAVCSEADTCHGLKCAHREHCFVLKARREAAKAQVLVANNHLLFADLAVRLESGGFDATAVLPPFQRLVFDEAHNMEKSATSFLSLSFSRFTVGKALSRLYRKKRGNTAGLVLALQRRFPQDVRVLKLPGLIEGILDHADVLNTRALNMLAGQKSLYLKQANKRYLNEDILEPLAGLEALVVELVNAFEDVWNLIPQENRKEDDLVYEASIYLRRLASVAEVARQYQKYLTHEDKIFWLEAFKTHQGGEAVRFIITPLDISSLLSKAVYEPYGTVVMTSATLTVMGDFSFFRSRVGLSDAAGRPADQAVFASPFNYRERVLLLVPSDAPLPEQPDFRQFCKDFVYRALLVTQGRGLVLFTSYDMLNDVYSHVAPLLKEQGISSLRQGDDDRSRLLSNFKRDISSVLFASDSFWEGVDSPGETLEAVFLTRLPFSVPNDPILKARAEKLEASGRNAFMELQVPEAVMRLRQGFGRLMRRTTDRGVVAILDARVLKKSYGPYFLKSLPVTRVCSGGTDECLGKLADFVLELNAEGGNG